jgi:hypothetical protein
VAACQTNSTKPYCPEWTNPGDLTCAELLEYYVNQTGGMDSPLAQLSVSEVGARSVQAIQHVQLRARYLGKSTRPAGL